MNQHMHNGTICFTCISNQLHVSVTVLYNNTDKYSNCNLAIWSTSITGKAMCSLQAPAQVLLLSLTNIIPPVLRAQSFTHLWRYKSLATDYYYYCYYYYYYYYYYYCYFFSSSSHGASVLFQVKASPNTKDSHLLFRAASFQFPFLEQIYGVPPNSIIPPISRPYTNPITYVASSPYPRRA